MGASLGEPTEYAHDFPFIARERLRRAAVICHRHADADSYLSAYALSDLLTKLAGTEVTIVIPEGMSTLTQKLAEAFPHRAEVGEEGRAPGEYDLIVAVDMGNTELLKDWKQKLERSTAMRVLIDHHPLQVGAPYDRQVVDPTASSAAEVVFRLFTMLGVKPDAKVSQALLIAILFDSQHLGIASEKTLRAVVELIDGGASLDEARALLRSPPDYGEVVAKLKAAKRMRFYRLGRWVLATSTVGSFQANVARAFISLGADVSVVAGEAGEETRGSLRANQRFKDATGIHLGRDVAERIAREKGYGGGHATAASFTFEPSIPEADAVAMAVDLISSLLSEKPAEIK